MAQTVDIDRAKELRGEGLTYEAIGNTMGVTRQAVHQAITSKSRDYQRKWLLKINGKYVKVNKRPRPNNICELCGQQAKKLDYHHWDDLQPQFGVWVCLPCHKFVARLERGLQHKYYYLKGKIEKMEFENDTYYVSPENGTWREDAS